MAGKKKKRHSIPFKKMHGIGNDYIYIDALGGTSPCYLEESKLPDLSKKISERHFGVGSDGLILILPSSDADFRMRIFNADGSEAKMCGNGIRCVGKYVYDLGFTSKKELRIDTASGIKRLTLETEDNVVENVIVDMGSPFFKRKEIPCYGEGEDRVEDEPLKAYDSTFLINGISMGNPHGVIFVDKVDDFPIELYGPVLEKAVLWPDRANIEFVEVISRDIIKMRVWERGSGETLACGTGACASAVISHLKGYTDQKVTVLLKGGELSINYDRNQNKVFMKGGACFVADGIFFTEL